MKLIYVAGPYRAVSEWEVLQNIRAAEAVALELWKMGFAVLCPHKNTAFFGGACPDQTWLDGDMEMLRRCDAVFACSGAYQSEGARAELNEAQKLGLPIFVNFSEAGEWLRAQGR